VAKGAAQEAETNQGIGRSYSQGYQGEGGTIAGEELPFLQNELTNPQGIGQPALSQTQTQAGQATAGALGSAKESATLNASRTGNTAAVPGVIDQATRDAMRQQSSNVLSTNLQNDVLKQQQRQDASTGLEKMYGTDVDAALQALGLSTSAINAQTAADAETNSAIQGYIGDAEKGASMVPGFPCWLAAAVFDEDFTTGEKTNLVRNWLCNVWARHWYAKPVLALYTRFGKSLSRSRVVVRFFTPLFERILIKAQHA
jgi:hypothetical protein